MGTGSQRIDFPSSPYFGLVVSVKDSLMRVRIGIVTGCWVSASSSINGFWISVSLPKRIYGVRPHTLVADIEMHYAQMDLLALGSLATIILVQQ